MVQAQAPREGENLKRQMVAKVAELLGRFRLTTGPEVNRDTLESASYRIEPAAGFDEMIGKAHVGGHVGFDGEYYVHVRVGGDKPGRSEYVDWRDYKVQMHEVGPGDVISPKVAASAPLRSSTELTFIRPLKPNTTYAFSLAKMEQQQPDVKLMEKPGTR